MKRSAFTVETLIDSQGEALKLETTILNHCLKKIGYHSAKEFNVKLLAEIKRKKVGNHGV